MRLLFLIYISIFFFANVNGREDGLNQRLVNCSNIHRDVDIEDVLNLCRGRSSISGTGSIRITESTEKMLFDFFLNLKHINVSLVIDHKTVPRVIYLGGVEVISSNKDDQISLFIENSNVERIEAPYLVFVNGAKIRGNRYLSQLSLDNIRLKVNDTKDYFVQQLGECSFFMDDNPNFKDCTTVNHLVLREQEIIPDDFRPKRIGGCVQLANVNVSHDFLQNVDLSDPFNLECDEHIDQVIINNPIICYKEYEHFLNRRNIAHFGNGNSNCIFHCFEGSDEPDRKNDISDMQQRWCETIEGDLIINDTLAEKVNISQLVMNLKRIVGKIIISNLTFFDNSTIKVEELQFPKLEQIISNKEEKDTLIYINNTNLKRISFNKLKKVETDGTVLEITEHNAHLSISKKDVVRVDIAANGGIMKVSEKVLERDPPVEETSNTAAIVGGTVGGIVCILALVAGVAVFVVLYKKNVKKGKSKLKKAQYEKTATDNNPLNAGKAISCGMDNDDNPNRSSTAEKKTYLKRSEKDKKISGNRKPKHTDKKPATDNTPQMLSKSQRSDNNYIVLNEEMTKNSALTIDKNEDQEKTQEDSNDEDGIHKQSRVDQSKQSEEKIIDGESKKNNAMNDSPTL